jgi:hypothetical protein
LVGQDIVVRKAGIVFRRSERIVLKWVFIVREYYFHWYGEVID